MKRILIPAMAILLACNQSEQTREQEMKEGKQSLTEALDTVQARKDLNTMADDMHSTFKKKDISFIEKYMSRNGIYLGTDPVEILNYNDYVSYMQKLVSDTALHISDYTISRRDITINGTSALIIDQLYMPEISKKLMLRNICHANFENGKWVVDMYAWNFLAKNEEIPRIDKAVN
ncbi:MAG TPA: nuclear transport factor 2 family protein [Chitinophagaceae bacterium]|nr:nuclear transport factor 2 family protein [Chitinophagaceae bacterium]